jgi:hypothetical protein
VIVPARVLAFPITKNPKVQGKASGMIKFLTTSIAATILLGVVLNMLGTGTEVMAGSSQVAAKGDRLDNRPNENVCGEWPFYHHACLPDLKNPNGRARKVRVISQTNHRHPTFLTLLSK